jgi:CheY-like chemotaxis protein/HPt (histidine-containing phosphotransfer) domain-containing protein
MNRVAFKGDPPYSWELPEKHLARPGVEPRLKALRILVVEDSGLSRMVVVRALILEGAEVVSATDGQQALDYLRVSPQVFHVVLMDVQMPVMDGLVATRALRSELCLTQLPVIALSAGVMPQERQKVQDAGFTDFLSKPLDIEEMVALLLRWTGQSSSELLVPVDMTGVQGAGPRIPFHGLDVDKGIAALQGDELLYRNMIVELVRTHGDDVRVIREAYRLGNLTQAANGAHALKGVAGNLAAFAVSRSAGEVEAALKRNKGDLVERKLLQLAEALAELENASLLLEDESQPSWQVAVSLSDSDQVDVFLLLDTLMGQLKSRRLAALEIVEQLRKRLAGTLFAPEMHLLGEVVERMEFVGALARAHQLSLRVAELMNQTQEC